MNVAAWERVWQSATTIFGHEPIQFRVVVVVGGAFLALMVLEGLRASFMPRRTHSDMPPVIEPPHQTPPPPASEAPQTSASTKVFAALPDSTMQHQRTAMRGPVQRNRKRKSARPRAHRNMLPKIRRMVTASEPDSRAD